MIDRNWKNSTLETKVGQMIVAGFPAGPAGVEILGSVVTETKIGNVIFFSRNVRSPRETFETVTAVRKIILEATGIPPLVAVDQEGGMVARVTRGVTPIPGAMAQAAAYEGGCISLDQVEELGSITGSELLALGFNWNLAPDADVNVNPLNPVIATRSFGEDPEKVSKLAGAFARGLKSSGILACAKHFPGHGDTVVDSHLGLPVVEHDRKRLESVELLPFRSLIQEGIGSIMSAHVVFSDLDPDKRPATLSSRVLHDLLRREMGFQGLIVTDCLEMKAIAGIDAAVRAVLAGADVLVISHTASLQREAFQSIVRAVKKGTIAESRIDESFQRILKAKGELPNAPVSLTSELKSPKAFELSQLITRSSLSLHPGRRFQVGANRRAVYLDVQPTLWSGAEDESDEPSVSVASFLKLSSYQVLKVSPDPDSVERKKILAACENLDVVMGLYALEGSPGQQELVKALGRRPARDGSIGFVAMQNPWDVALARKLTNVSDAPGLSAWEYTRSAARAVADFLTGRIDAPGKLPVSV